MPSRSRQATGSTRLWRLQGPHAPIRSPAVPAQATFSPPPYHALALSLPYASLKPPSVQSGDIGNRLFQGHRYHSGDIGTSSRSWVTDFTLGGHAGGATVPWKARSVMQEQLASIEASRREGVPAPVSGVEIDRVEAVWRPCTGRLRTGEGPCWLCWESRARRACRRSRRFRATCCETRAGMCHAPQGTGRERAAMPTAQREGRMESSVRRGKGLGNIEDERSLPSPLSIQRVAAANVCPGDRGSRALREAG